MQGNRSTETEPERILRSALWQAGLRGYRKNVRKLPGSPDIVFGPLKLAVFVHGCYWHRCPKCSRNIHPRTNSQYWKAKFKGNVAGDKSNTKALRERGYDVIVGWECDLKKDPRTAIRRVCKIVEAARKR